jgi:AsmA protein
LARVKAETGREARIDGDFKLSLLPRVEFVASKVSFANAPGGQAANLVTLDRLMVRVAVFPLLSGNVEVDTFVLEKPVISLEVDKAGKPNWQIAAAKAGRAAPASQGGGGSGNAGAMKGLKLGDVRLVDGKISYFDARTGVRHGVDAINATVSLPSLASPMKADGSLVWNKEKIALTLGISNPEAFAAGKATDIDARIDSGPVKLSLKGAASSGKVPIFAGPLTLDVPSIRKLAAWVGSPIDAPGSGYGPLKIAGEVAVNGDRYAFEKAELSIDDIKGTGAFAYDGRRRVPLVTAKLNLNTLDLNPYLPPEGAKAGASAKGAKPAAGGKAGSDWSDDPIDLRGLKSVNAVMDLAVAGLKVRKIKVGQSNLKVSVTNGVLVTDLTKMALYGGNGRAKVTADGRTKTPAIALDFDLAKFQAGPFLTDSIAMDRLSGTANASLKVTARGGSQRALVSALNGAGKVTFLDGAIRGINLGAMARNVKSAFLDPAARKSQKTDFAELGGTYTIRNGILTNTDLLMKSPLLRLTGKGKVNLPRQTINYRMEPKLVASATGQGGQAKASGIAVPVIVSGPWSNLSYKPDLSGALKGLAKDPNKALESLKGLIPGAKGTTSGTTSGTTAPSKSKPLDKLKGLFGR